MKNTPVTQTSTSRTEIPAWLEDAARKNIGFAQNLPGFTPYTGQGVAGLDPNQQQALELARSGSGTAQGFIGQAANRLNGFKPREVSGADIEGLLSPYTNNVVNTTNSEIDRQRAVKQMQLDSQGAGLVGYNSDRRGVVESMNDRDFTDVKARTTADLMDRGWNSAAGIAGNNADRYNSGEMSAINGLLSAGAGYAGANASAINGLMTTGGTAQQTAQNGLNFNYGEFMRGVQDPYQRLQAMTAATNGAPHGQTTNGTQTQDSWSSPLMGLLGAGIGAMSGNPMAVLGGLGGAMGGGRTSSGMGFPMGSGGGMSRLY